MNRPRFMAALGLAVLNVALAAFRTDAAPETPGRGGDPTLGTESASAVAAPKKRVAVLSAYAEPEALTSQGLYIKILQDAGLEAWAVNAAEVREKKLEGFDIFIIGGGMAQFSTSRWAQRGAEWCKSSSARAAGRSQVAPAAIPS